MNTVELDDVDRGILHLLQEDARRIPAAEIADRVGVSASTVRNRIDRLETEGVIRGYYPDIDYERMGYRHQVVVVCRAPMGERADVAADVRDTRGVVTVREMVTGSANLRVEAVGRDPDAIERLTGRLTELHLDVRSVDLVKNLRVQTFDGFELERADAN